MHTEHQDVDRKERLDVERQDDSVLVQRTSINMALLLVSFGLPHAQTADRKL